MNRITEMTFWLAAVVLAALVILREFPTSRSNTAGKIPTIDNIQIVETENVQLEGMFEAIATTTAKPEELRKMFYVPARDTAEFQTEVDDEVETEPESVENIPETSDDIDMNRFDTIFADSNTAESLSDSIPQPEEEPIQFETVNWLVYVGRMTRNTVNVYYVKNTRTGSIMQIEENQKEGSAVFDSESDSELRIFLSGEPFAIRLDKR